MCLDSGFKRGYVLRELKKLDFIFDKRAACDMCRRQQGTACGENSCTQGKDRRCEAFILDSPGSGAYKFFKVEKFNFIF